MLEVIGSGVTSVITWLGNVLTAITTGSMASVLPVIGISIAMGVIGFGIRTIKSLVWGF